MKPVALFPLLKVLNFSQSNFGNPFFFTLTEMFQVALVGVDYALSSHARSHHEVSDVMQCFRKCRDDLQCLSFNLEYNPELLTMMCELNGATIGADSKNYVKRPGCLYYEKVDDH